MAVDQAYKQDKTIIKDEGGASGMTEDPSAEAEIKESPRQTTHHEQTPQVQTTFLNRGINFAWPFRT